MNTMIGSNEPNYSTREQLLDTISDLELLVKKLDKELDEKNTEIQGKRSVLALADESLRSYKQQISDTKANVESLVHEHLDLEGTEFFDGIVDLFEIELTKTVTLQFTVSVEVQATVPAGMSDEDIEEELSNAKLDYEHLGNGDIEINGFDFGDMEVE